MACKQALQAHPPWLAQCLVPLPELQEAQQVLRLPWAPSMVQHLDLRAAPVALQRSREPLQVSSDPALQGSPCMLKLAVCHVLEPGSCMQ